MGAHFTGGNRVPFRDPLRAEDRAAVFHAKVFYCYSFLKHSLLASDRIQVIDIRQDHTPCGMGNHDKCQMPQQ